MGRLRGCAGARIGLRRAHVSRRQATDALSGIPGRGLTTGITWLDADLLASVRGLSAPSPHPGIDRAQVALALGADLAFVAGGQNEDVGGIGELHDVDVAAIWTVEGVFGRAAGGLGWAEALRLTAADPGALAARLDAALHGALRDARAGIEAGADALLVADDLASPSGPLLSPDYALDALLPCYRRLAAEARSEGIPAVFHSDGEIRVLIPALARAGFTAVHLAGLGAPAFSANATAARHAGLVVLGSISAAALPQDAAAQGERAAALALSLGAVIVCDDGGITTAEQVAGLERALERAREAFREGEGRGAQRD